jgi:hypothetical protein
MAKVIGDVCVKVGTKADGKGRYENVGTKWQKEDGGTFVTIKRTFNPAGVPNPDNKDNIILSIFDKKDNNETQSTNEEQE